MDEYCITVVKSFKNCSISNAIDGTDILFEDRSNDNLDESRDEISSFESDNRSESPGKMWRF